MRGSDRKLFEALHEIGVYGLAADAKAGNFNEFFGPRTTPMLDLVHELRETAQQTTIPERRDAIEQLVQRVIDGEFDATREEQEEWVRSEEGRLVMREIRDE